MLRLLKKSTALTLIAVILTVVCLPQPAVAQSRGYPSGPYSRNYGHRVETGGGELGRSLGGATGMAVGAVGGAALAAAVVKAAGIASLGGLATTLTIAGITACTLFLGSKVFSTLGQSLERSMGAKNLWTMVGATLGAIAAISFLGSAGMFAGPAGLILKGLIGGLAGGTLARLFSGKLEILANPRLMYPIVGGLVAAVGGLGIAGAIGGVAVGYVMGSIMDSVYFADRNRSLRGYANEGRYHVRSWADRFRSWLSGITNWVKGRSQSTGDWARRNWDDDPYYQQGWNQGYYQKYDYDYTPTQYRYDYGRSMDDRAPLYDRYGDYRNNYETFIEMNRNGASIEARRRQLEKLRNSYQGYDSYRRW